MMTDTDGTAFYAISQICRALSVGSRNPTQGLKGSQQNMAPTTQIPFTKRAMTASVNIWKNISVKSYQIGVCNVVCHQLKGAFVSGEGGGVGEATGLFFN